MFKSMINHTAVNELAKKNDMSMINMENRTTLVYNQSYFDNQDHCTIHSKESKKHVRSKIFFVKFIIISI